MKEIPLNSNRSLKEKLQDIKDSIMPRKLGYYKIIPSPSLIEKLPAKQLSSKCYTPVKGKTQHQIDTRDYAALAIKGVQRTMPKFDGLIFDARISSWEDTSKAMQLYAKEYNLSICTVYKGRIRVLKPEKEHTTEK